MIGSMPLVQLCWPNDECSPSLSREDEQELLTYLMSEEFDKGAEEVAEEVAEEAATEEKLEENPVVCCLVCGEEAASRPSAYFLPFEQNPEFIAVHVFCGKTAALPPNERPDLEILNRSGIKHKFGSGACVQVAKSRCRMSIDPTQPPEQQVPEYYLTREFEAHLSEVSRRLR